MPCHSALLNPEGSAKIKNIYNYMQMILGTVKQWLSHWCVIMSHRVRVLQLPQVDVLHCRLECAQAVAELVFTGVAEAEVSDVAQVGHPDRKRQESRSYATRKHFLQHCYPHAFCKSTSQYALSRLRLLNNNNWTKITSLPLSDCLCCTLFHYSLHSRPGLSGKWMNLVFNRVFFKSVSLSF